MCGIRPSGPPSSQDGISSLANFVWRKQRMGFRLSLDLLDLGQPLVAVPRRGPGGIDRPAKAVHIDRKHASVAQVRIVRDAQKLVALLALSVHPVPQVL